MKYIIKLYLIFNLAVLRWSNGYKFRDMDKIFFAIDEHYSMHLQYKNTLNNLQYFDQKNDWDIRENIAYFVDWMKRNYDEFKFFKIYGQSLMDANILYRIRARDKTTGHQTESWLMSDIIRYVENMDVLDQKYVGKVKFTKVTTKFENEVSEWRPPKKSDISEDKKENDQVDDIQIVVYDDNEMRCERRYEVEHGWNHFWSEKAIYLSTNEKMEKFVEEHAEDYVAECEKFLAFEKKWSRLRKKRIVPGWYNFDPRNPEEINHNLMKEWNPSMFNFLKEQKWKEFDEIDNKNGYRYIHEEESNLIIDCSQLLGIGGEAIVIKRLKIRSQPSVDNEKEYTALKIIPIKANKYKDELKNQQIKTEVTELTSKQISEETEMYLRLSEEIMITNGEIKSNQFNHDVLMKYSNIELQFYESCGEKSLFLVIGRNTQDFCFININLLKKCLHTMYHFGIFLNIQESKNVKTYFLSQNELK